MNEASPRPCSVCGELSRTMHLGMDACRACAIFYRRAKKRTKAYVCKRRDGKCPVDRDDPATCKRCRLDRFLHVQAIASNNDLVNDSPSTSRIIFPSASLEAFSVSRMKGGEGGDRPVFNRLRRAYSMLCRLRETAELSVRTIVGTVSELAEGGTVIVPGTCFDTNRAVRILINSLFDFATLAFDEFVDFDKDSKWQIVRKFHEYFELFEPGYRSWKHFPEYPGRYLINYTSYMDIDDCAFFFRGASGNTKEAEKILYRSLEIGALKRRPVVENLNLDEEEFLAALGFELWDSNRVELSDENAKILDSHRAALLTELHFYYKNVKKVDDYAVRIGNIYAFNMRIRESVPAWQQSCEMYRLFDVMQEDTFMYHLSRA